MSGFVKTSEITVSGAQKAAILLSELGQANSIEIFKNLKLSTKEMKKIRVAMELLGIYNPQNEYMTKREGMVLEAAVNYGIRNCGFKPHKVEVKKSYAEMEKDEVNKMVNQNPDAVANLLKAWLDN